MSRNLLWGLMALSAAIVAAYALSSALVPSIRTPFAQGLIAQKTLRPYGHLLGGGVSIMAGAFQFNATLRGRRPAVHRLLGRTYLASVAIGGLAGLCYPVIAWLCWVPNVLGAEWMIASGRGRGGAAQVTA